MLAELLFFCIYVIQQLGVMLGVGAEAILLCAHLVAVHRREPEVMEGSFPRAARVALGSGLMLMVLSGFAAVALHGAVGQLDILLAPAFIFKWILIAFVLIAFLGQRFLVEWSNLLAWFAGGTWFALFLVHSLAPVITWLDLLILYVAWMTFFALLWSVFLVLMHGGKLPAIHISLPKPTPKPVLPQAALPLSPKPVLPSPKLIAPAPPLKPVIVPPPVPTPVPLPALAPKPVAPPPQILSVAPEPHAPLPVPPPTPPPPPRPQVVPPPRPQVVLPPKPPVAPVQPAPAPAPAASSTEGSSLAALRVMPKNLDDLTKSQARQ